MTHDEIESLYQKCKRDTPPITYWYKHVPNGPYDDVIGKSRLFIYGGFHYIIVSKAWIEEGDHSRLEGWEKEPWGTYPDLPPKPPKKV